MKNALFTIVTGLLIVTLAQSCRKDEVEPENKIPAEVLATNDWIYDVMSEVYFWNSFLPELDRTKEADPAAYFEKLLYEEDKWSYITDDYKGLLADLSGEPKSMGFYPYFITLGQDNIFIVVAYVFPNSPAANAGLKRGDIIITIDNKMLTKTNFYDVFSGESYSVQLASIQGQTLVPSGVSYNMTAQVIQADPIIYQEVIEVNDHKIGYLVYVSFTSGDNNKYLTSLNTIISGFKSQGINDLVVDLRNNPGGDVNAATNLASSIAPSSIVENSEILIRMRYNKEVQAYLESDPRYATYLAFRFTPLNSNLNLSRVAFLTNGRSASASELVIIGLEPYMDVIQIGEPTYGKYTGSTVIEDEADEWALMPIISKYENIVGKTDFVNGLEPDFEMEDEYVFPVPFGELNDPMLAQAVLSLTGQPVAGLKDARTSPFKFEQIIPREEKIKYNLFMPSPAKKK